MQHHVTILNGKKSAMSNKTAKQRREARRNPDETLASKATGALVATIVAAPLAVAADQMFSGMKKGGTGADRESLRYTANQSAALTLATGVVIAGALTVKDTAPGVGKAILAAYTAVAAQRAWAARKLSQLTQGQQETPPPQTQNPQTQQDQAQRPGATPPARGVMGLPRMLPAASVQAIKVGTVKPAGAAVGPFGNGAINASGEPAEDRMRGGEPHVISANTSQADIVNPPGTRILLRHAFPNGSDEVRTTNEVRTTT